MGKRAGGSGRERDRKKEEEEQSVEEEVVEENNRSTIRVLCVCERETERARARRGGWEGEVWRKRETPGHSARPNPLLKPVARALDG